MVVIAVAGGTGDVGQTVVEELVRQGKHQIVILSRKVPDDPAVGGPEYVAVDYSNIGGMAETLEKNNVHTVFSAMAIDGPSEQSQLNLIAAAGISATTERFIPSEFVVCTPEGNPDEGNEMTAPILRARQALAKTGLKTTYIANGTFMDYFGLPHIPSQLRPNQWALDVSLRRAAIPGTGDEIITLTYSRDLARFVARLMDDDDWPKYSNISGSDTCLNDMVAIAEKVTGERFHVTYDSAEDIKAGKASPVSQNCVTYNGIDPVMMAVMMGEGLIHGAMHIPKENRLNDRYPEIVPMSIEELITTAWAKK